MSIVARNDSICVETAGAVLSALAIEFVLLDYDKRIKLISKRAEALMCPSVRVSGAELFADSYATSNRLQEFLSHAVSNYHTYQIPHLFPLARLGKRPVLLRALKLAFGVTDPFIAVVISDPDEHALTAQNRFMARFHLTKSESNLASLLAEGKSLEDCAEVMGLALSSTRQLAKQIMAKTDTHRQSQLVSLLLHYQLAVDFMQH